MARLRIRELARERGMTISALQRKADIAMRTARRYWYNTKSGNVTEVDEEDRLEEISISLLKRIADVLSVSVGDLFTDDPENDHLRRLAEACATDLSDELITSGLS